MSHIYTRFCFEVLAYLPESGLEPAIMRFGRLLRYLFGGVAGKRAGQYRKENSDVPYI